jgi:phosphoserine phosphatase
MREAQVRAVLDEVTASIAGRPDGAVAAFDGDGTLWSGDVGEDFFHAFVTEGDFRPPAVAALAATARAHGLADDGDGRTLAQRVFTAYEQGAFPEQTICEVIAWAPAGRTWAEYRAFFEERYPRAAMQARLHEETAALVEGIRALGVEAFLVSASPKPVVESAARAIGIAADHVVAAEPIVGADGTVLAAVDAPIPYGAGKVRRLRERIGARELVVACGDNAFDEELLREARIGCAVRPKPRLVAIADRIPGLRILRR